MNECLVSDLGGRELRFQGNLILERETQVDLHDEFTRSFAIKVYAVEGGGFVPTLEYTTTSPGEKPVRTFENVDTMKDIECFYFVFETNEVRGDWKGLTRAEWDQRTEDNRRLEKRFEKFIFPLLDEIWDTAERKGFVDKQVEKKKSLWTLLG